MKKYLSFSKIFAFARLLRAKAFNKTVRFYVGDLRGFYRELDETGTRYLILRWDDEVPLDGQTYRYDIDHLVESGSLDRIAAIAARFPGRYKTDWYSQTGERGGAYYGMPYYTPWLASELLGSRVRNHRGLWIPAASQKLRSFLYHLVYHKGPASGLPIRASDSESRTFVAKRDYGAEALRLATSSGDELPTDLSLYGIYQWLKSEGWHMPEDALSRWPARSELIELIELDAQKRLASITQKSSGVHVFLLRSDVCDPQALQLAREMIAEYFVVLMEDHLSSGVSEDLVRKTRGGDWVERGFGCSRPWYYFIARVRIDVPPLKHNFSARKLRQRYPQIEHPNILVKRFIRERVTALPGVRKKATVLHATDNAFETAITLETILDADQQEEFLEHLLGSANFCNKAPAS